MKLVATWCFITGGEKKTNAGFGGFQKGGGVESKDEEKKKTEETRKEEPEKSHSGR